MPDQILNEYKKRNTRKFLLVFGITLFGLLCIAALLHIGAGDAEWGGMTVSNITPSIAMEFNIPKDQKGVVINWCEDPSYSSGLRSGDLVKAINNKKVQNISEFLKTVKNLKLDQGILLDVIRNGEPLYITLKDMPSVHENFKKLLSLDMGTELGGALHGTKVAAKGTETLNLQGNGQNIALVNPTTGQGADTTAGNGDTAPLASQLPTPKEQGAAHKELVEGHWLGMEVIPLVPELAKEFNISPNTKGVLVDEISLESAESGVLAGDMVVAIEGYATPDLYAFTESTRRVKNKTSAKILVSRRGQLLEYTISSTRTMGFSQNESAQPIKPGAISPHRSRGKACTECHIIMETGGQLPIDAGDILPSPPPIIKGAVAPHEDRGKCNTCHVILKDVTQ